jgi:glycosyltransferase involved in cell wall biosynthesis/predicted metal-dependent phosphoesterase TrpH
VTADLSRCDLHVHSRYSTDSGNYALRRARLGESYTEPERVHRVCKSRGMRFVTISDHNTLEGALRIAHLPDTFLSVEVTTRFPEDGVPLHVLVWNLTEEDHLDLQELRPSVYALTAFLRGRGLAHALAHPLYRMGAPLTPSHVERLMLLFPVWEGRNGARPQAANELACRLAAAATPAYVRKLAERHGIEPPYDGSIGLTGGSDDHGALDIATTWTEAPGSDVASFLGAVMSGLGSAHGAHGSTVKLAHAVAALAANAYRAGGGALSPHVGEQLEALFDEDCVDAGERHTEITDAATRLVRALGTRAREGALEVQGLSSLGPRVAALAFAGALQAPYLAAAHHHAGSHGDVAAIERAFFGVEEEQDDPRALVFTDTFDEANGVAGTMRRLAAEGGSGRLPIRVATARPQTADEPGLVAFSPDWSLPLPGYELLELRFPVVTDVLTRIEAEQPDVVHVATPGPVGVCGLIAAKLLGIPVVGSYHTELGPYALHLTRDLLVAEAIERWVDWFYGRCDVVLAPTSVVATRLEGRGLGGAVGVWGRGVDTELFRPERLSPTVREQLLDGGNVLFLYVGRLSSEKRVDLLLGAFRSARTALPGARLAIVGDGPARARLEARRHVGVTFLGELRGEALATAYASADVFCFPSATDTFGQVLLEAAASGLPAVAAAAGGALELVRHAQTGLLVPPDDADLLARALVELGGEESWRRELGRQAVAAAQARTWQRAFDELRQAYRTVAGGVRPPVRIAA